MNLNCAAVSFVIAIAERGDVTITIFEHQREIIFRPLQMPRRGRETNVGENGVVKIEQRGKLFDARVTAMPFVPHRYHRQGAGR